MKKLMEIGDVFESKEHGNIIIGINPELDTLSHTKIREKIGDCILVQKPDNKEIELKVISVQIANSLIDKKTIGICIGKSVKVSEIPNKSFVFVK
ncbi:hypothetical protein HOO54_17175 [Bacillus sp. WMMC1349]|uniref:hypothetical protein n=1 Tax=Bacillus sp. WMMC1349 TaxID=2736254 RepID=UPI001552EC22|nr:hypothetical protein [Bacillus sp. WMMC1349]NPC93900.1 hypothetical protein [Bacillus sp. WMMC1349]